MRLYALIVVVISTCVLSYAESIEDWSHRIASKKKYSFGYFLNPCGNVINELIVDGKIFSHVRGESKFYIPVPKTNTIVFITDEKDYSITYHVFNMDTDEDIQIPARNSAFGNSIGSSKPSDSVIIASDGTLVLCNIDKNAKSTLPSLAKLSSIKSLFYLNPERKEIISEKIYYYDADGKLLPSHLD
jgi:hypothetical protein